MICILLLLLTAPLARAQCILSNPSFEVGASGALHFGGWNQFGIVSSSSAAEHGQVAAQIHGTVVPWGTSAVWQALDTSPGEVWQVAVRVQQDATAPLSGASIAMVNLEWRDAADALIDFESHPAMIAGDPTDSWQDFSATSAPAPVGAVKVRLLLGVLQGPGEPAPIVRYDSATFFEQSSPTMDEQQWVDFPGGRIVNFAGYDWRVKGPGFYEPGPAFFADTRDQVWIDAQGELHLAIRQVGVTWYSTELALTQPLGYGYYVFTTRGSLDAFDQRTVLGLFLWQYGPCWDASYLWWNPYNEIDVEFSRWDDPSGPIAHFTAQPFGWAGNQSTYDATFGASELSSHAFRWRPDRVEFRSWRGGPDDESTATVIHTFLYTGPHIPRPEQPRVHMNLWSIFGPPASEQSAVIADFRFRPEDVSTAVDENAPTLPTVGRLLAPSPNPFNPRTTIRFELERPTPVRLVLFDLAGRRVRTLVDGARAAGRHDVVFDGLDEAGAELASGVYLLRMALPGELHSQKVVLVR